MKFNILFKFVLIILMSAYSSKIYSEKLNYNYVSEQTWLQIRTLKGIKTQSNISSPSVFIFFDPNCPYCAKLWSYKIDSKMFKSYPAIWIPVSYLNDDSMNKAALLIRDSDYKLLDQNLSLFDFSNRNGGIKGVEPTDAEKILLGKSKAVWVKLGGVTPMIVFRNSTGDIKSFLGLPKSDRLQEVIEQFIPSTLLKFDVK